MVLVIDTNKKLNVSLIEAMSKLFKMQIYNGMNYFHVILKTHNYARLALRCGLHGRTHL